jgi:hypothetical protein
MTVERESIDFDVLFVGGGPARLKPQPSRCRLFPNPCTTRAV